METLKNYVNWKLAHSDKVATAEGYPLVMENCKINKRMKQLEVYGDCLQSQIPSPDNPSEIQSVGDLTTKNLFDMEVLLPEQGWVKQDDGSYYVALASTPRNQILWDNTENYTGQLKILYQFKYLKGWSESPVGSYIQIKYTDGTTQAVYLYTGRWDADTWYVPTDSRTITNSSKTVSQIMWTYGTGGNSTWVKDIIITKDINTTEYEPYHKYKIPITARGKNLLPNSDWMSGGHSNGFTEQTNVDYITEYTQNSVSFNLSAWKGVSSPRFQKDSVKRIVFKINQNAIGSDGYTSFYIIIQGYDDNNNKVGNQIIYSNAVADTRYVFDFSAISSYSFYANSTQFSFCILARKNALSNLMVYDIAYYAETDMEVYEPYIEPITQNIYLDEPLRGALYQSREKQWYYDVIDYKSHKVIRNIAEKTFTGATNEEWINSKETDNKIHFYIANIPNNCSFGGAPIDASVICNLFNESYVDATQNSDKEGISLALTTNMCYIAIFKTRLADAGLTLDLDGFKTWLSQNPITVTYISKTPTEEDISCQLPKTLAKTTIIEVDTTLLPSNLKGKYIIK